MRYSIDDIRQMPEGQTFDCKSILVDPKALAVTIVAMANADGGMIAVGVSDKTRCIEGVDQDKAHLNEVLRTPFDFCIPTVSVTTEFMECTDNNGNANHILIIHVPASIHLHTNQADEAFWRVGDKSRKLTFEERLQLMYDKGERYYEDTATYNATLDDIDLNAVEAYARKIGYGKTPEEYLRENKGFLINKDGGQQQVSAACVLLFGKRPQNFFPRARVRFIRYYGTEEKVGREMNVIKDVTFEGTILSQIQQAVAYLETQVKEHSYLGEDGLFRTDREYPKFVLQEMVVNSVCHRDYSIKGTEIQIKMFDDRIVFETPGKLPGIVRTDNIRHTHFSRNPKIAEFLKAYNYVKEFGEGVDRMYNELTDTGVREPQYQLVAFLIKATVWMKVLKDEGQEKTQEKGHENLSQRSDEAFVNESDAEPSGHKKGIKRGIKRGIKKGIKKQEKVLALIKENTGITIPELAKLCNVSDKSIRNILEELRKENIITRVGPKNGGRWEINNVTK